MFNVYKIKEQIAATSIFRLLYSFLLLIFSPYQVFRILTFRKIAKNKKVIAFAISDLYMFKHISSFFLALKNEDTFIPILIISRKIRRNKKEWDRFLKNNHLIIGNFWYEFYTLLLIKVDIFLETAITSYCNLCNKKVIKMLYAHGLSGLGFSKDYKHIKKAVRYDCILLTGPMQKKALEIAAEQFNVSLPKMKEVGFSFGDRMRKKNKDFNKKEFNSKNNLKQNYTILFAPTWGIFSATKSWIDNIVKLSKDLQVNLIIRLHPLMLNGKSIYDTAGVNWKKKMAGISKTYSNCLVRMESEGLEEDMLASDLLITDVSSLGIEYFLFDKPVIFLPSDEFFKIYGKNQPIYWVRNNREIRTYEELLEKVKYYISNKNETTNSFDNLVYNTDYVDSVFIKYIKNILDK